EGVAHQDRRRSARQTVRRVVHRRGRVQGRKGGNHGCHRPRRGEGHQDRATGAASVVQAAGKGRRRRHDQYQLVHRSSGLSAGQVPFDLFRQRLLEGKNRLPGRLGCAAGCLEELGQREPCQSEELCGSCRRVFRWLRKPENFDVAVKKYGTLAGVTTPAAIAVYKKWLGEKRIFLDRWDQKVVDAEWQFLEMAHRLGVLPAVPDKTAHALLVEGPKG